MKTTAEIIERFEIAAMIFVASGLPILAMAAAFQAMGIV